MRTSDAQSELGSFVNMSSVNEDEFAVILVGTIIKGMSPPSQKVG